MPIPGPLRDLSNSRTVERTSKLHASVAVEQLFFSTCPSASDGHPSTTLRCWFRIRHVHRLSWKLQAASERTCSGSLEVRICGRLSHRRTALCTRNPNAMDD
eukprot:6212727-Pleurochrysis_carterae.AAC.3